MNLFDSLFGKKKTNQTYKEKDDTVTSYPKTDGQIYTNNLSFDKTTLEKARRYFIAIDLETTGFSSSTDKIIEVGAVKFIDGKIVDKYNSLVKIDTPIPVAASNVNHITDDMLISHGKEPSVVYKELITFLQDCIANGELIVAHNAAFDMSFLSKALSNYGYSGTLNYLDTLKISRDNLALPNYKQPTVAEYFGIINTIEHRAVSDAETCGKILVNLFEIANIKIENSKEKQAKSNGLTPLNEEETEIGAILLSILSSNNIDISKIRFYKNSANYIDVIYVYTIWKYKVSTKGNYIIIPKIKWNNCSLKTGDCTKSEYGTNIRVYFENPFDLKEISSILIDMYNEFIENANYYNGLNRYEKEFLARANTFQITDLSTHIENAQKRVLTKAAEQEKVAIQKEELRKQQEEREQAKRLAKEEVEQKKLLAEQKKIQNENLKNELLQNAESYTIDSIKMIINLSQNENKRAVIKLDDDDNIFKVYESVAEASKDVGISPKTIRSACKGELKHGGGFCWKYADEYIES